MATPVRLSLAPKAYAEHCLTRPHYAGDFAPGSKCGTYYGSPWPLCRKPATQMMSTREVYHPCCDACAARQPVCAFCGCPTTCGTQVIDEADGTTRGVLCKTVCLPAVKAYMEPPGYP